MKQNHFFLILIVSVVILGLITNYSCRKDNISDIELVRKGPINLEEAKNLFNHWQKNKNPKSEKSSILKTRTDSATSANYSKYPDWSQAVSYYDDDKEQQVMEVPGILLSS